jgi:hypothetical protein
MGGLCLCEAAAAKIPVINHPDNTALNMEQGRNDNDREKPKDSERNVPESFLPLENQRGLKWARTRVSTVANLRLTPEL